MPLCEITRHLKIADTPLNTGLAIHKILLLKGQNRVFCLKNEVKRK